MPSPSAYNADGNRRLEDDLDGDASAVWPALPTTIFFSGQGELMFAQNTPSHYRRQVLDARQSNVSIRPAESVPRDYDQDAGVFNYRVGFASPDL